MRRVLLVAMALLLLAARPVSGAEQNAFRLDGDTVLLATQGAEMSPEHTVLTIVRGGRRLYGLAAPLIEIVYRRSGARRDDAPDLIATDYAGGAHCCYTVHVLRLGAEIIDERIPIRDSELTLDASVTPPRLRFYDFAFAYWNASFADSPAPPVILAWQPSARRYLPDVAAMRRPAPDAASLASQAAAVQAKLEKSPADRLDPALWGAMLDLIYTGNAAAASRFLDLAWPPDRPGKAAFRAEFARHLRSGELWRRYSLGSVLAASQVFR